MVSSTGTTTLRMSLNNDSIRITDFEIFNDIVYFCGYKDSTSRIAMMGYFPLATFPNSTVKYNTLPDVWSFNKMDVFSAEGQVHVVMTAKQAYSGINPLFFFNYTIVDARENSDGSWLFYVLDNNDPILTFDDVAVTDSHVVFTARSIRDDNNLKAFNTTEIWYFNKPTMYGVPVFLTPVNIGCLYNWPEGQVIIEHLFGDNYVISSRKDMNDIVSSLFNYLTYNSTCKLILDDSIDTREVIDIKYNRYKSRFEVLLKEVTTNRIFTFSLSNYYNPASTVQMRKFKQEIQSIDFLTSSPNFYVASGHDYNPTLNVCRYNQLVNGNCFELSTVPCKRIYFNYRKINKDIFVKIYYRPIRNLPSINNVIETITICN